MVDGEDQENLRKITHLSSCFVPKNMLKLLVNLPIYGGIDIFIHHIWRLHLFY
jgi:hypothetical protein